MKVTHQGNLPQEYGCKRKEYLVLVRPIIQLVSVNVG